MLVWYLKKGRRKWRTLHHTKRERSYNSSSWAVNFIPNCQPSPELPTVKRTSQSSIISYLDISQDQIRERESVKNTDNSGPNCVRNKWGVTIKSRPVIINKKRKGKGIITDNYPIGHQSSMRKFLSNQKSINSRTQYLNILQIFLNNTLLIFLNDLYYLPWLRLT